MTREDELDVVRRLTDRRQGLDDNWRAALVAAVAAGRSLREVAEAGGCAHETVRAAVKAAQDRAVLEGR